jgi:hypothetical protein
LFRISDPLATDGSSTRFDAAVQTAKVTLHQALATYLGVASEFTGNFTSQDSGIGLMQLQSRSSASSFHPTQASLATEQLDGLAFLL